VAGGFPAFRNLGTAIYFVTWFGRLGRHLRVPMRLQEEVEYAARNEGPPGPFTVPNALSTLPSWALHVLPDGSVQCEL
jgi:hypothetical protein